MTERPDNQAEESVQEWEGAGGSRRKFLGHLTAFVAAAAAGTLGASDAEAAKRRTNRPSRQQPGMGKEIFQKPEDVSIEKIDDNTFKIGRWEAEKNGEGLRGKNDVIPGGWDLRPVTFDNDIVLEGRKTIKMHYLLPLVRDLGECARHESTLKIDVSGMTKYTINVKPVVSEPNHNQFLEIELLGNANPRDGNVVIHPTLISWVTQAAKPVGFNPHLLQHANSQSLQDAQRAYISTRGMFYDASAPTLDPSEINGRGDCGTFSVVGKQATNGRMEVVIGWSERCIQESASNHSWNVSRAGGWVADSTKDYVGPDSESYIPSLVGNEFVFPPKTDYAREAKHYQNGMNTGFSMVYNGTKELTHNRVRFSTPGNGMRGQELQQLALNPPENVKAAHDAFVAERQRINQKPNAEVNVAKRQ